jgi:general secretion pathway protein G
VGQVILRWPTSPAHSCGGLTVEPHVAPQPRPDPRPRLAAGLRRLRRAEVNRAKQDIRSIETALNIYRLDNYSYPSTDDGLEALVTNPGETRAPNWLVGGYLPNLPRDPWNRPYEYLSPGQHGSFDIFTLGADGQEGGEGNRADIGNWELN